MDSDTGGGRSKHDLSDIMSMLDEGGAGKPEPTATKKAAPSGDNAFARRLLADIERKNAENLKLSSENMSLKYALGEKDLEIKKLRARADGLDGQVKALEEQAIRLNRQIEDMKKYVNDAKAKLGEMEADRAKLGARFKEEEAPPAEDDVASIFKRISSHDKPPGERAGDGAENVQKRLKTAKLYDL